MDLIFALAFVPDKTMDLLPVPYLLQQYSDIKFRVHKRLNKHDLQINFVLDNPWAGKIIELSDALTPLELNKKNNKKHKEIGFHEFLKDSDDNTQSYLKDIIDRNKIELIKIVKEFRVLMFFKQDYTEWIYKNEIIEVSDTRAQVKFDFEKRTDTLHYRLKVYYNNNQIDLAQENIYVITNKEPSIIYDKKLISFDNQFFNGNKLKPFLKKDEIVVNEKMEGVFFKRFLAPAIKKFEYSISGFDLTELKTKVVPQLVIEKTFTNIIIITPVFWYRKYKIEFYKTQEVYINVVEKDGAYFLESIRRDIGYEITLLDKLRDLGFEQKENYYYLRDASDDIHDFTENFNLYVQKIRNIGFEIISQLFKKQVNYSIPKISYQTQRKQDWFDIYIIIDIGDFEIEFKQLKHHILNRIREFILPDSTVFIIPNAWFSELYTLAKKTNDSNASRIHKTQLQFLKNNKFIHPDKTISGSLSKLEINTALELPKGITAKLRDYQETGYQWLYQLTQNGFGACLADDMGLGKTLQVICVLQKYFENRDIGVPVQTTNDNQFSLFDSFDLPANTNSKSFSSALLVVPKSLIFNWIEELRKFAPELTYTVYHGNSRHDILKNRIHRIHIILTTYGMVRTDIDELKSHRFSYLVADESQAIKNPQSKIFKAIMLLQSDNTISITGTPIENSLSDLWAQMSFLNDNILGNRRYFEETYMKAIHKDHNSLEAGELKSITGPFILRRLKKDVAKELPPKIEQVIYCQMHESQKEIYETEKSAIRNEILFAKNRDANIINALAMLNKLRQIAIHPFLIDEGYDSLSGKFDSILHVINNLMEQGHKFLIFSSFVKHLKLFQYYFEDNNVSYSMLTGRHNNRQKIVGEYENNAAIKPFLISIKAGGVGLNIIAASYVLIIDPWWNPFVELQAIDRTHRIGQTQKVVVYKFITNDTVEEKMIALQKSKLKLSDTLINENDTGSLKIAEIEKLLLL